jgi:hypothetical protein
MADEMTELYDQVTERAREIRTDAYSMSIGEVISMYRDEELEIHPEFQRIFRWTSDQRSRLVESILLGIPIPTIFVAQRDDGVWDVIDGVQRLSTILEFVGEYKDEDGTRQPASVLSGGEYLEQLGGVSWAEDTEGATSGLDVRLRRDFKRAKLSFSIIKRESDPNAKFDLFQRLNAGSTLSLQEARNCLLIMINRPAYLQLDQLTSSTTFNQCIAVSETKDGTAYRSELVLRFFAQAQYDGGNQQLPEEFGSYLTNWMKRQAEQGTDFLAEDIFSRTFALLARSSGGDSFRRYDGSRNVGGFSIASFEFITAGLVHNLDRWEGETPEALTHRIREVWSEPTFRENSGSGISSRKRLPRVVNGGREFFSRP